MKILGLDISSVSTGWAITDRGQLYDHGLIVTDPKSSLIDKLVVFRHQLTSILQETRDIDWVAIEDTYYKNMVTVKTLSKFAGVALSCIGQELCLSNLIILDDLEAIAASKRKAMPQNGVVIISPAQLLNLIDLKNDLHRDDKKAEVVSWVNSRHGTNFNLEDNDITDAIALSCGTYNRIKECLDEVNNRGRK